MGQVISSATMSLDGYVANADNSIGRLFDWFDNGTVQVESASPEISFSLTPQSAAYWRGWMASLGALVVGRELFDVTDGWQGTHPLGVPVVVLTHHPPTDWSYPGSENFHFVTDGIAAAIGVARDLAARGGPDKNVGVAAGTIARQALEAGLLDQVAIDLAPVVMGAGRPYFGELAGETPLLLGDPVVTVQGERVTHLVYPVER